MKKFYLSVVFCCIGLLVFGQTTFYYTGAYQTYTVPTGVTKLAIDMYGAAGGGSYASTGTGPGANGGRVQCNLTVTPGEVLYIYVGSKGADWISSINYSGGGYNGGGFGGANAACGGGASDIRTSASGTYYTGRLIVAGGGGGGGDIEYYGGAGGDLTGGTGQGGACGGGQTGPVCYTGHAYGSTGYGGNGDTATVAGGGGGYFGGNAGVILNGGGGGGSSYTDPILCTYITHTQGYTGATGNGEVTITPFVATCTSTVSAGTAVISPSLGSSTTSFSLRLAGATTATGLAYQWQSSTTSLPGSWSNISGAIDSVRNFTGISAITYFRCYITCPGSSSLDTSIPAEVFAVNCSPTSSSWSGYSSSTTYYYTGSVQTWTVPFGLSSINVDMQGATGGSGNCGGTGGSGGRVQATLPVAGGAPVYISVGGAGSSETYSCCSDAGGGSMVGGNGGEYCGGGGGASDIRIGGSSLSYRMVVAGGGGGGGYNWCYSYGGAGGGLNGEAGMYDYGSFYSYYCGQGGTQTYGGAGATVSSGGNGYAGSGGSGEYYYGGGGGGGGYYGGGGGYYGGGGGGSSFTDPSATSVTHTQGYNGSGNGTVIISYNGVLTGYGINSFFINAPTGANLNDTGLVIASASPTGYLDHTSLTPIELYAGFTVNASITWGTVATHQETQVWIDFNDDGIFQSSEEVTPVSGYNTTATPNPLPLSITVPSGMPTGIHLMRIRGILEDATYGYSLSSDLDPCLVQYASSGPGYNSGNMIDYLVDITTAPSCTGTPDTGSVSVVPAYGSDSTYFTLALSGVPPESGITYQWQSSTSASGTWTNISGATNHSFTFNGLSATMFFHCVVTCTGSGISTTSGMTEAFLVGCVPTSSSWSGYSYSNTYSYTGSYQTWSIPSGVTTVSVDMQGATGGSGYCGGTPGSGGRVQGTMPVTPGSTAYIYVGGSGSSYTYSCCSDAQGGSTAGGSGGYYCGGGGGASDIRLGGNALTNRTMVAGGGGGGGYDWCYSYGGAGGGLSGADGQYNYGSYSSYYCGLGGNQTSGGAGATASSGGNGSLGTGGYGEYYYYGGAGGGGYYGGGGGYDGGGGGGSSYTASSVTSVTHTQGYNGSGNGSVTITYSNILTTYGVNSFNVNASTGASLSDGGLVTACNAATGYLSHISLSPITLYSGFSTTGSITWGTAATYQEAQVWIDFNNDGTFQSTEEVSPVVGYSTVSTPNPTTFAITIPGGAPTGNHLMRVRGIWENSTYGYSLSSDLDPCLLQYASSGPVYNDGNVVDYMVNIATPPSCSGTPVSGTVSISPLTGNGSTYFTLGLSGVPLESGLSYQWQSSSSSTGSWTNISGATNTTYSYTGLSADTYFHCVVTCSYSGISTASSVVEAFYISCTPTSSSWTGYSYSNTYYYTGSYQTWSIPSGVGNISVDMQGATGGSGNCGGYGGYGGRVQATLPVTGGSTVYIYVAGAGSSYSYSCCSDAQGGSTAGGYAGYYCGGGGGASDIRIGGTALSNRKLVAGGGGGGGYNWCYSYGGSGGGLTGADGQYNYGSYNLYYCGQGGNQTSGGGGATISSGGNGSLGTGGYGEYYYYGGGGGGGYYGGGGGYYGGGGGGSSYADASATSVTHTQGYNGSGNGSVTISYNNILTTYGINAFFITASTGSNFSDTGLVVATGSGGTGYLNHTTISPITLYSGFSTTSTITWGTAVTYQEAQVWIDFNNDGVFQSSEEVSPVAGYSTVSTPNPTTFSLTIPSGAPVGNHLMRIRGIWENSSYGYSLSSDLDPCLIQYLSSGAEYNEGNAIDYIINIAAPPVCSGTPDSGGVVVSPLSGSSSTYFTLTLTGVPIESGLTYQWQSSPSATGSWTDITGATNPTYSFTGLSSDTYFHCVVTCSGSGISTNSAIQEAFLISCTPTATSWSGNSVSSTFSYTGSYQTLSLPSGVSSINVDMQGATGGSGNCGGTPGYGGRVQATLPVTAGSTVYVYVAGVGSSYSYSCCSDAQGGSTTGGSAGYYCGGGGGASDIRIGGTALSNRKIVAGGGGGGGYNWCYSYGGSGGGLTGADGQYNYGSYSSYYCGLGGNQTTGGAGASASSGGTGSLGTGGYGEYYYYGGAGGGGYYGGGGGYEGGGGGGSSYTDASATSVTHTQGYNGSGNGSVTISYTNILTTYGINSLYISASTGVSLYDTGLVAASSSATGYLNHTYITPVNIFSGFTTASTITWGTAANYQEAQVWIDFNNDGTFQSTEEVSPIVGFSTVSTPNPTIFSLSIPTGAPAGNHLMRIRGIWENASYGYSISTDLDPCLVQYASSGPEYNDGNAIDYVVNIVAPPSCSGTPDSGIVVVSPTTGTSSTYIVLSLTGVPTESGLTYQWQSSSSSFGPWTDITGATDLTYGLSGLSYDTYYECIVSCSSSGLSATSSVGEAFLVNCTPTSSSWGGYSYSQAYYYTGSYQTWSVPAGLTSVNVDMYGATGGSGNCGGYGGYGGRVQATLPVTPGSTVYMYVGGQGSSYSYSGSPAQGGSTAGGYGGYYAGGGGGASDIRIGGTSLANRMIVAGGGGGGGYDWCYSYGGSGGGLTGGAGQYDYGSYSTYYCGQGGTQTYGGSGATASSGGTGTLGTGGYGEYYYYGGAGGGGYEGGGGGYEGGGGGGSSYTDPSVTSVTHTQGYNGSGNGVITVSYNSVLTYYGINTLFIQSSIGANLNDTGMVAASNPSTGYVNRTSLAPVSLYTGFSNASTITWGTAASYQEAQAWIDFNNDGTFDLSEEVTPVFGYNTTSTTNPTTFNISIPAGTTVGHHLMRIRGVWENSSYTEALSSDLDPCLIQYMSSGPQYKDGNVADYVVNIVNPPGCSGAPDSGVVVVSPSSGYSTTYFTLSVLGIPLDSGFAYQWQSSPSGTGSWTNISGATNNVYTFTGLSYDLFYHCVVTCTNSSISTTSSSVEVFLIGCTPGGSSWIGNSYSTTYSYTGSYQTYTVPTGVTSLNVDMRGATGGNGYCSGTGGYGGRLQAILPVSGGSTVYIYVAGAGSSYSYSCCSDAQGGATSGGSSGYYCGGGGGASDIRIGGTALSNRMIVAGGGGGGGYNWCNSYGGAGGGLTGQAGMYDYGSFYTYYCGQGGTQSAGGTGATASSGGTGSLGTGGYGEYYYYGGAGGGGYYGGGGGYYGGGGGGSSYTDPSVTGVTHTQGYNGSGNGSVAISYSNISTYYGINSLAITASTGPNLVDTGLVTATNTYNGYLNHTAVTPPTLWAGSVNATTITWGDAVSYQEAQLWIDFNNDGTFQVSEEVSPVVGYNIIATPNPTIFNVSVPSGAPAGNHLMRIRGIWESSSYTQELSSDLDPCLLQYMSSGPAYNQGNVVDYIVTIATPPGCTGTPDSAIASVTPTSGTSSTDFTLSLAGLPLTSGFTYQWKSASSPSGPWTNISGATTATYNFTGISAVTYFKCSVSCTSSGLTRNSSITQAALLSCSSTSASWYGYSASTYSYTGSVQNWTIPLGVTSINVDMQGARGGMGYDGGVGGAGGRVQAKLPVSAGSAVSIYVGGVGGNYNSTCCADAVGGSILGGTGGYNTGGGGGASDIRIAGTALTNRMIVAGGGGGGGYDCAYEYGGAGGGTVGGAGVYCSGSSTSYAGQGGTQYAGGAGGTSGSGGDGSAGSGGPGEYYYFGGAGGGGYYGGGGGYYGGGGGGSSYTDASATGIIHTQGYNATGNGVVNVNYYGNIPTYGINSLRIVASTGTNLVDSGIVVATNPVTGYLNRISMSPLNLYAGITTTGTITWGVASNHQEAQFWIDFNDDGNFQTSEEVSSVLGYSTTSTTSPLTFNISIPGYATTGSHLMRMRGIKEKTGAYGLSTDLDPCLDQFGGTGPVYNYGDEVDYPVNIQMNVCSGTPTTGTVSASATSGCSAYTSVLSLSGAGGFSGIQYQWQSSTDDATWSNISDATANTYSLTVTATEYYRCTVTCTISAVSASTTGVLLSVPVLGSIAGGDSVCIGSTLTLSDSTSGGAWSGSSTSIASIGSTGVITGISSGIFTATYTRSGCSVTKSITVNTTPSTISGTTSFCAGSSVTMIEPISGGSWTSSSTVVVTVDAVSGTLTGISGGTAIITNSNGCGSATIAITVNPIPSVITGTLAICNGSSATLSDSISGGSWMSGSTGIVTINSVTGIYSGLSNGVSIISYTNSCGTVTVPVTVNAAPGIISGSTSVCLGSSITLSETSSGTWASSSTSVASVNPAGIVTGISGGTATISFTNGCSTAATVTVTVIGAIPAITGTTSVCVGSTVTMAESVSGGSWSCSAYGTASVGTSSGIVTGISQGTASIFYTTTCGVVATTVSVNAIPTSITGTFSVCAGSVITLSETSTGGSWTTGSTGVATVNPLGVVTGISGGTSAITYSNGCGTAATAIITVTGSVPSITGSNTVCVGSLITLSESVTGTWSSGSSAIAMIDGTGHVTGESQGTTMISFTNGCSTPATFPVTVNGLPATIAGTSVICAGEIVTLSETVTGGTWSSSASSVAGVDAASGVVTGVSGGTTNISYSNGCGSAAVLTVTVNGTIAPITGSSVICLGSTSTLGETVSGGTWSSGSISVASVSSSGIVTGVSTGTASITYNTGCTVPATLTVSVNASPSSIYGTLTTCISGTTSLSEAASGGSWVSGSVLVAGVDSTGLITGIATGTSVITYSNGCGSPVMVTVTVNSYPSGITGSSTVCSGDTTTLSGGTAGGVWTSVGPGVASVSSSGRVTGISCGYVTISYTNVCGTATMNLTVNCAPTPISAADTVICIYGTTLFTDAVTGGVWTNTTGNSSVDISTGLVTGVSVGMDTIVYTAVCGIPVHKAIKIISGPGLSISGMDTICISASTSLSDSIPGGTWSSSVPAIATVNPATGIVTGVTAGTVSISYSTGCGTPSSVIVTVNAMPAAITGSLSLCQFSLVSLSDSGLGYWHSSSSSIATVDGSGNVFGTGSGIDTITYTLFTGGCSATRILTVHPFPNAGVITGPSTVCAMHIITLTDTAGGSTGNWYSSDSAIASVSGAGFVTGNGPGTVNINYAVTNGCGTGSAHYSVTVNPLPAVSAITGLSNLCVGTIVTLSDTAASGTWSSTNPSVATVSDSGHVIGWSVGADTIKYTMTNTCGFVSVSHPVRVNAIPTSITGTSNVCFGSSNAVFDLTPAGTWSSSDSTLASITPIGDSSALVTGAGASGGVITLTYTTGCGTPATTSYTINPLPVAGTISGSTRLCAGANDTLSESVTGGSWSLTNTNAVIVSGSVIAGIISGNDTVVYTKTNMCGTVTAHFPITVNASPVAGVLIGSDSLCTGSTITLVATSPGGSWTASNTNASVSGGVVTGSSAGNDSVIYTVASVYCGSARVTKEVTVIANPVAGTISGSSSICIGNTATMTETSPGGTWISNTPSIAGITPFGVITALVQGPDTISYAVTNYCGTVIARYPITVNPLAASGIITGVDSICKGSIATFTESATDGTWRSLDPGIAHVDSVTGIITAGSVGLDSIRYIVTNMCNTSIASHYLYVKPLPVSGPISVNGISGAGIVICKDHGYQLTDSVPGGTWTSVGSAIAITSIDSVVGVHPGAAGKIIYSVSSSCGIARDTLTVSVDSPLNVAITGTSWICLGHRDTSVQLSGSPAGGTWSSFDTAHALVSNTGLITPVAPASSVIINYSVSNVCGTFNHAINMVVYSSHECDVFLDVKPLTGTNGGGDITVYPNPNTGSFTVELPRIAVKTSIIVMDIYGKIIETRIITDSNIEKVDFSFNDLASGTYMIRVISDDIFYKGMVQIFRH